MIQELFAKHCFPSALRLQRCIALADLDTDERHQVLFGVKRLIATHIVVPARIAFFARGGSGIDYSAAEPDWSAVKPVTDTFRPLVSGALDRTGKESMDRIFPWKAAELLPDFFHTAARCVPRDAFRKQAHESPWLETLFVAVAELAYEMAEREGSSNYLSEYIHNFERLVQVVLDGDVRLSLHTLFAHVKFTGILTDELAQVQWNLIALFIKLGVDIFLPSSGFKDSKDLLDALLEMIKLYWRSGASDSNYDVIKNDIVIPLMRGFTDARDLPTFIELWRKQLASMERARIHDSNLRCSSVWEDEDLCDAFGELVKTSFMDAHIATQIQTAATEIKVTDRTLSTSPRAYANLVVLEAILRGRNLGFETADGALVSVLETISPTLEAQQSLHWRWRLWRLARTLLENCPLSTHNNTFYLVMDIDQFAVNSIRRCHQNLCTEPCATLEGFEIFRFIIVAMAGGSNTEFLVDFNSLIDEILPLTNTVSNGDSSNLMGSQWDGRPQTLNSLTSLVLGYLVLLVSCSSTWGQIEVERRRSLFAHMLSLAAAQYDPRSSSLDTASSKAGFLQVWTGMVCHEYLINMADIVGDLIHVLVDRIKNDASNRRFCVESLRRIPASSITRRQRGIVLDLLQNIIIQGDNDPQTTFAMVSLMAKLAELPKTSATVTSSWEPIWKMAETVTLKDTELDLELIKAFRSLDCAVISKLVLLSPAERKKVFPSLSRKLTSMASELTSIHDNSMKTELLMSSLNHLWAHRKAISNVLEESQLRSCREKAFEAVVASLKHIKGLCKQDDSDHTNAVIKILDVLGGFEDLATGNKDVAKLLGRIEGRIEKSAEITATLHRLVRRCVLASQGSEEEIMEHAVRCAEVHSILEVYGQDQKHFIESTTVKFQCMGLDELAQIVTDTFAKRKFTKRDGENRMLLATLAVAAMPPVEDKESHAAKCLAALYVEVWEFLPFAKTVEQFSLATECLGLLFRHHPRCSSQFNVDNLLNGISKCLSKYGPRIDNKHASTLYMRICQIMGVVLGTLRVKIGGRHHVAVTIVRKLLNCLLDRSQDQGKASVKDKDLPNWFVPLQASDAENFSRLLTSLSDPTVSAASRPTGHELIDQTKKAKGIAGQYLQYFIVEYTRVCLQGTFVPEVKAAILPGLYSSLDVLLRETMLSLNTELEASSRAVFRALYDDYTRFGKWNKG